MAKLSALALLSVGLLYLMCDCGNAQDAECGTSDAVVGLEQQFDNAGNCENYTVNSSVCNGTLTPQVDHIYIHSERKYGGASFVYGQQEIMDVVDGLLDLVLSPDCIDVMKEVLCLFYYSPCGNETHDFLPPPSLCQDSCRTIMNQCSEDWERVLNASRMTDNEHLWFTDCAAEYLHNSNFKTVKTCCVQVSSDIMDITTMPTSAPMPTSTSTPMPTSTMSIAIAITQTPSTEGIDTPNPRGNSGTIAGTVTAAVIVLVALVLVCVLVPLFLHRRRLKKTRLLTVSAPTTMPRSAASLRSRYAGGYDMELQTSPQLLPKNAQDHSDVHLRTGHTRLVKVPSAYLRNVSIKMLIPGRCVTLLDCIGQGEFGIVYRASVAGWGELTSAVTVAAKTLKNESNLKGLCDMLEESKKMKSFDHPNVLGLIGVCLELGPAPYIITKHMSNGSLLNFLKKERHSLTVTMSNNPELVSDIQGKLLPMCLQIAKGMEYLADKKFVHRDLAARNCMIDEKYNIKVADFGLSEDVYAKNYFRQDKFDNSVKLPFKWMALESLHDGIFTEKTDMWSYGVTCWEVFTCGRSPYPAMDPPTLLRYLEAGNRLDKPKNEACSDEIYSLVMKCWLDEPMDRPAFTEIVSTIEHMLERVSGYLQFSDFMAKACVPSIEVTDTEAQENNHHEHDSAA